MTNSQFAKLVLAGVALLLIPKRSSRQADNTHRTPKGKNHHPLNHHTGDSTTSN